MCIPFLVSSWEPKNIESVSGKTNSVPAFCDAKDQSLTQWYYLGGLPYLFWLSSILKNVIKYT